VGAGRWKRKEEKAAVEVKSLKVLFVSSIYWRKQHRQQKTVFFCYSTTEAYKFDSLYGHKVTPQ